MIPASFDYHAPKTLEEAFALLGSHGALSGDAKVLSGGQSLLPLLKLRLGSAGNLVDIGRIPGLEYIREEGGFLRIGGRTRESALEHSDLVRSKYPILADTAEVIADPLVRNLATVGGNLAHGDPANDHPATMLAVSAEIVATGPGGSRTIPVDDFFLGLFQTALAPDEILTEIRIPEPADRSGGAYVKLERKVGDFATAAAAVQLTLGAGGAVEKVGIALTNAGPKPIRAVEAERFLTGQAPTPERIAEAARLAGEAATPGADRRGQVEYKKQMARVLTGRALQKALGRASGPQAGQKGES
jgi:carbon-monoxide dehydrogenase medium subunit